jgi:hypothetical protein
MYFELVTHPIHPESYLICHGDSTCHSAAGKPEPLLSQHSMKYVQVDTSLGESGVSVLSV